MTHQFLKCRDISFNKVVVNSILCLALVLHATWTINLVESLNTIDGFIVSLKRSSKAPNFFSSKFVSLFKKWTASLWLVTKPSTYIFARLFFCTISCLRSLQIRRFQQAVLKVNFSFCNLSKAVLALARLRSCGSSIQIELCSDLSKIKLSGLGGDSSSKLSVLWALDICCFSWTRLKIFWLSHRAILSLPLYHQLVVSFFFNKTLGFYFDGRSHNVLGTFKEQFVCPTSSPKWTVSPFLIQITRYCKTAISSQINLKFFILGVVL